MLQELKRAVVRLATNFARSPGTGARRCVSGDVAELLSLREGLQLLQ